MGNIKATSTRLDYAGCFHPPKKQPIGVFGVGGT